MQKLISLSYGSVIVGIIVLCIKYYAYAITGSLALLSDAMESIVNVVASLVMVFALRLSAKPADSKHHYGHYKLEYFSAFFEGIVIVIASLTIFKELYYSIYNASHPIEAPFQGLLINGIATLLNGAWGFIIIKYGKKHKSPAMLADGKHLLSDVVTSCGIAAGLFLVIITKLNILDSIVALSVAIYLLYSGASVIMDSFSGLMDAAPHDEEMNVIHKAIHDNSKNVIETHDLRVRRSGRIIFIDFHMVVSSDMTVKESHDICDEIEDRIKETFEDSIITIHVEPEYKRHH